MNKNKFTSIAIITITILIAGIAIYTAFRLYGSGQSPIAPSAPSSEPYAWDCSKYVFDLNENGEVTVRNDSTRNEPSQQAQVFIDGQLVTTLEVPALAAGENAAIGQISIPSQPFSWKVIGTRDCQNAGNVTPTKNMCESISFEITQQTTTPTPTGTVRPTATPQATATPTDTPVGGGDPSPTPQATAAPSPTVTNSVQSTATPTQGQLASGPTLTPTNTQVAQTSPTDTGSTGGAGDELPDSGFDDPIWLFAASSLLILLAAFILAF